MADLKTLSAQDLHGKLTFDVTGDQLGSVEAVYLDRSTGRPEWAAIRTGRQETSLVPLIGASLSEGGIRLAVDRALVGNAPYGGDMADLLPEMLSEEQEAELYHYYSVEYLVADAEEPPRAEG